jgi:predicted ABC-type transport system involved in lysophospholipase L1 biosynthesis ATPase subunit
MEVFNGLQVQAAEEYYNAQVEAKQSYDKQFDDFCSKQFGKDREKIVGEGFNFIAQNVTSDLVEHVNNLPNEALATVAALAYNLKQKYGVEDRLPQADPMLSGGGNDMISLKQAIGDKMNSPEYSNAFHARHSHAVREVQALSEQLAKLTQPRRGY